jgi:hypothetical protein
MLVAGSSRAPSHRRRDCPIVRPVINEQKIKDLYLTHVGSVEAERAAGAGEARFVLLDLHALGTIGHSYATLGASDGPLQHELVLDAVEPFASFGDALEAIARAAPVLAPQVVIPFAFPDTPFTALVCLPLDDAGGSFSLSKTGGPPYAFRLAPLTPAEQALAERDPGRMIDLLRDAYAFTADRYRACLVDVPPPPPAARTEIALQRRQARAALVALQADVLRQHGPREDAGTPGTRRRRRDNGRLFPGSHLALLSWVEETIREALLPYVRHPARVAYFFGEFIYVTFATHPDAVRMIDRALDPRNLPRPVTADPRRQVEEASRSVTEALAVAIARCHPGTSETAILAQAQPAIREALSTFDPADEIPLENHVWATLLPALYEGLDELKQPATRGLPQVFRRTAQSEAVLEYEPDPRPPLVRLKEISARLATGLVTAYAAGLRGQLPK